ncbi:hypothetical protein DFH09DRAFT_1023016 [Mycena vulgaris]|nr:hypothetical protein DFH09DRAFT_1023016 [Mycena vulgaris]
MSFISNADNVTLGEGVHNNIHGNFINNFIHNTFYGKKRHREAIEDAPDIRSLEEPTRKRRRPEEEEGIKVIRSKHLKLTLELGSGPGYFLHAGEAEGRAVIVKVFNAGPTVREQLESTVALSNGLMHSNVLRIEGVSSPASSNHFIAYENAHWKTAENPLAAALKDDLTRSVTLGFKMVAGLSSGMNYLSVQGISLASLGVENFDIFLDLNDRFLISVNPPTSMGIVTEDRLPEDNTAISWDIFNALCEKVLRSANRVLHNQDIERKPVALDLSSRPFVSYKPSAASALASNSASELPSSPRIPDDEPPVQPRREYVWRTIDCGQQSLANVARRISHDLDMKLYSVNKLVWTDGRSAHRCAGYIREEVTLATTTRDSAVVSHDAPSPLEICAVCNEVVGVHEVFQCVCGDPNPGLRPTVKCQACKLWSHSDCVGNLKEFTCQLCEPAAASQSDNHHHAASTVFDDFNADYTKQIDFSSSQNPSDILAPHPDFFELELDPTLAGLDDNQLRLLSVNSHDAYSFLRSDTPTPGPSSNITVSSESAYDSLSFYSEPFYNYPHSPHPPSNHSPPLELEMDFQPTRSRASVTADTRQTARRITPDRASSVAPEDQRPGPSERQFELDETMWQEFLKSVGVATVPSASTSANAAWEGDAVDVNGRGGMGASEDSDADVTRGEPRRPRSEREKQASRRNWSR